MPTFAEVLAEINANIVPNGNNEITADVLRPILEAMLQQPNELIGDMTELTTAETATLVDAINSITAGINQNNIPRIITFTSSADDANPVTPADVATMVNAVPGGYVITETSTPVIISVSKASGRYIFLYKKGKGIMGGGASNASDFFLLVEKTLTESDLDNDPDTTIIPLGELPDGDYVAAANAGTYDFSDSGETAGTGIVSYYFSYLEEGVLYFVLFVGEPGIYGEGETAFTEADFVASTNSTVEPGTPIPTIDQVLASGHIATNKDLQVEKRIDGDLIERTHLTSIGLSHKITNGNGSRIVFAPPSVPEVTYTIPAKEADDTVAMLSDIGRDLPKDFWVSGYVKDYGGYYGRDIMYKTDIYRLLNLYELFPEADEDIIYSVNNINVNGNNIFLEGGLGADDEEVIDRFVIALYDCRIIDNMLIPGSRKYKRYTGISADYNGGRNSVHHSEYDNGFLYYMTRPNSTSTTLATQILKFNAYDLEDYKILTLPATSDFVNISTVFHKYKNWLYFCFTERSQQTVPNSPEGGPAIIASQASIAHIVRVDEELNHYEKVFDFGLHGEMMRVQNANYFLIHSDELILFTFDLSDTLNYRQNVGVVVTTLTGQVKRSKIVQWNDYAISGSRVPVHWATIFNNKLMLSVSASAASQLRGLVRIDAGYGYDNDSIVFEDFVEGVQWTNDNSVTKDGYLLMNPENVYGKLWKIKYNDFTDLELIDPLPGAPDTYWSVSSINPTIQKESLKTKLSDFENDINAGVQDLQSVLENGSEASVDETISITNTTVGALTIASEGMSFQGSHGGINFNASQTQITSSGHNMDITAGAGGSINFEQTTGVSISGNAGGVTIEGYTLGVNINGGGGGVDIDGVNELKLNGGTVDITGGEITIDGNLLQVESPIHISGAIIMGEGQDLKGGHETNNFIQLRTSTNQDMYFGSDEGFIFQSQNPGNNDFWVQMPALFEGTVRYNGTPTLTEEDDITHKAYVDEAISASIPEGIITLSPESPEAITNVWYGTQAEYDAIVSPDPDTEYNIEDDYQEFKGSISIIASGTTLIIPHSLGVIPVYVSVTPKNSSSLFEYVAVDENNIYIHLPGPSFVMCEFWIQYNN